MLQASTCSDWEASFQRPGSASNSIASKVWWLGYFDPSERSKLEFDASVRVTQPLTSAILQGDESYSYDTMAVQNTAIAEVSSMKKFHSKEVATILKGNLTAPLIRAVELAQDQLNHCFTNSRTRVCFAQECSSGCTCPEV